VFHNRIAQLVYTFPEDAKTSQGANFWSAPKRFPSALDFDPTDPLHLQCIRAGANLKAEAHGIERPALDDAGLAALVAAVPVAQFAPKAGVTIETGTYACSPACVGAQRAQWRQLLICTHTCRLNCTHRRPAALMKAPSPHSHVTLQNAVPSLLAAQRSAVWGGLD